MTDRVPILMYHRVSPLDHSLEKSKREVMYMITVSPEAFREQMNWLSGAGYQSVTLDDLIDHRFGNGALPERPVIITFDDGYQDVIDNAVPVLRANGFTAQIFLVAGLVGKNSLWDQADQGWSYELFDWDNARALAQEGFQIGAHTMTHPRLTEIDEDACQRELSESRQIIADQLGREIHHFAYPFGAYDERVRSIVEDAGFRSACSVHDGLSGVDDDPLALHRVNVSGRDSLRDFRLRLRGFPALWERRRYVSGLIKRLPVPFRGSGG